MRRLFLPLLAMAFVGGPGWDAAGADPGAEAATQPLYDREATAACINRRGKAAGRNPFDPRFMQAKTLPSHPTLRQFGITSRALHVGLGKVKVSGWANETIAAAFLRSAVEAQAAEREIERRYLQGREDPNASAAIGHRRNVVFFLNPVHWFTPAQVRRELAPFFACLTS